MSNINNLCFSYFSILNYLNERILLYSLICITFVGVFVLHWILKSYTFFIKAKVPSFRRPIFPYGHFKRAILKESHFSVHLDKQYRKLKKEKCKFGGLFMFTAPIILIVNPNIVELPLDKQNCKLLQIFNVNLINKCLRRLNPIKNVYNLDLKNMIQENILTAFGLITDVDLRENIEYLVNKRNYSSTRFCFALLWKVFNCSKNCKDDLTLRARIQSIIKKRKKDDIKKHDLLDGLIEFYNDEHLSMEQIIQITADLVLDTLEFSYNTILFCLFELSSNLQIQEELIAETQRIEQLRLVNLDKLVYLDAVVKEAFRKYPPVPTIVLKKLPEPILLHNKLMNKCKCALIPTFSLQRDPTNYLQPSIFDPDRFLEEEISDSFFMPFGNCPSSQINMTLTTSFVKIGLVQIFRNARISTDVPQPMEIEFNPDDFVLCPKNLLKFKFI